jgi:hypothetical protein
VTGAGGAGVGALSDTDSGRGALVGGTLGAAGGAAAGKVARGFAGRAGMTPKQVIDVFKSSGAMQAAFLSMDRNAMQEAIKKATKSSSKIPYSNPFEALRAYGMAFENANRVGEMVRILESEGTSSKALSKAAKEVRDVSIDFSRGGAWPVIGALRQMAAFWNARVQGYSKVVRAFKENPRRAGSVAIAGIAAPSMMLYAVNRNNPDYWETNIWERNLFWLVPLPESQGGGFLRIPKPFELGLVFGSSFERMFEAWDPANPESGEVDFGEAFVHQLLGEVQDMVAPMPTALQPFWENWTNTNWNGIPVVPPYEEISRLPDELKGTEHASDLGRGIGETFGVSPARVDNILTAWTGRVGWTLLDRFDDWKQDIDPERGKPPAETFREGFLVRRFFSEKVQRTPRSVSRVYEKLNEAESAWNAVKTYTSEGRDGKAKEHLESHADEMNGLAELRDAVEEIGELKDLAQDIDEGREYKHMSPEQKRVEIRRIYSKVTGIARDVLDEIEGEGGG